MHANLRQLERVYPRTLVPNSKTYLLNEKIFELLYKLELISTINFKCFLIAVYMSHTKREK